MKKSLLRFIGVFIFLYLVFRTMLVLVSVRMTGWQFIVFIVVLAGIVEYIVERK